MHYSLPPSCHVHRLVIDLPLSPLNPAIIGNRRRKTARHSPNKHRVGGVMCRAESHYLPEECLAHSGLLGAKLNDANRRVNRPSIKPLYDEVKGKQTIITTIVQHLTGGFFLVMSAQPKKKCNKDLGIVKQGRINWAQRTNAAKHNQSESIRESTALQIMRKLNFH